MSSIKFHEEDDTFSLNLNTATLDELRRAVWVMKHEICLRQDPDSVCWDDRDVTTVSVLNKIVGVIDESIGKDPWEVNK